jgi:hypothetical protein
MEKQKISDFYVNRKEELPVLVVFFVLSNPSCRNIPVKGTGT